MTSGARCVEVALAGVGASCLQVGDVHRPASSLLQTPVCLLVVEEGDDGCQVGRGQREGRHALVGPSGPHDGADAIAADVLRDQRRTRQVRAAFTAGGVAAMTETALRREQTPPGVDLFRWERLLGSWSWWWL